MFQDEKKCSQSNISTADKLVSVFVNGELIDIKEMKARLLAQYGMPLADVTVRMHLVELVKAGKLLRIMNGRYALPGYVVPAVSVDLRKWVLDKCNQLARVPHTVYPKSLCKVYSKEFRRAVAVDEVRAALLGLEQDGQLIEIADDYFQCRF